MFKFPCGRTQRCGECEHLEASSSKDVCLAVAHVAGLPEVAMLSDTEIGEEADRFMQGIVDDDDHVTSRMRDAATASVQDLIANNK